MHNKQYIIFLTAITMVFAACGANQPEINPNPNVDSIHIDARQLIGMWKISFSDDLEDDIPGYYQFNSDGTFEYLTFLFSIDFHSNIHFEGYYCQTGTYSVDDSLILFSPNRDARWYSYKNDVLRILGIFERGNAFQYSIVSGSENQLLLAAGEYTCDLMKLSQKPDEWDSVFFEPEKDLSEDALIGNWDLLNKFTKDYWWWYGSPSEEGIQLLEEGETANNSSFVAELTKQALVEAELMTENEVVFFSFNTYSCSWGLKDNTISFVCASPYYDVFCENDSVLEYVRTITVNKELAIDFTVYSLSDHFLILHDSRNGTYYVFSPGTDGIEATSSNTNAGRFVKRKSDSLFQPTPLIPNTIRR